MVVVFSALMILFAMYCAGSILRPMIVPVIIFGTVVYLVIWSGIFDSAADRAKAREAAQHHIMVAH